jgi:hypothetical protein
LEELPPIQAASHWCYVTKRYKYISLVLREQGGNAPQRNDLVITLHATEAKKLASILLQAVAEPVSEDFIDVVLGGVEGVYVGGPPARSELAEFRAPFNANRPPR